MYSSALINSLHQELQRNFPRGKLLLGGSYFYGEADDQSDLDFYYLSSVTALFLAKKIKQQVQSIRQKFPGVRFSLMLVPDWLFRRGWYFIDGKDLAKERYTSPLRPDVIIRNSLKFALWYLLNSKIASAPALIIGDLRKAAHQLAAALLVLGRLNTRAPFAQAEQARLLAQALPAGDYRLLQVLRRQELAADSIPEYQARLQAVILKTEKPAENYWRLAWRNYLLYNLWFGRRGLALFLTTNPDKLVRERLVAACSLAKPALEQELAVLKQIIFPVIIF